VVEAAHPANDAQWQKVVDDQPAFGPVQPIPAIVDKWHFINAPAPKI
jgi:hypothetical protein